MYIYIYVCICIYVCMYGCMYVCMYLIYWTSIRRIEHIAKHEDEDTMMSSAPDYMHLLCIFLLWAFFFLSVHLRIVWMWVRKMHKHMHTTTQQEGWHNSNRIFFWVDLMHVFISLYSMTRIYLLNIGAGAAGAAATRCFQPHRFFFPTMHLCSVPWLP